MNITEREQLGAMVESLYLFQCHKELMGVGKVYEGIHLRVEGGRMF